MKKHLLTIGSVTFDIFVRPKVHEIVRHFTEDQTEEYLQFPFGEKIRIDQVHECFGGGAANTAIGFSRQDIPVKIISALGKDNWANAILDHLKKEKVNTDLIENINNKKTAFSVIINSFEGERTVLAYSGACKEIENIDENQLDQASGMHLCHLSGKSSSLFEKIRNYFEKNPSKFLSWNPGKEQIEKGLEHFKSFLKVLDIIFINREEAGEFSNISTKIVDPPFSFEKKQDFYDFSEIFNKFYKLGFQGILVITDGRRGAQACDGKDIYFCPIDEREERIDTLGAGDAFASGFSGFIFKHYQNEDFRKYLPQALKSGTLNSASVISKFGAQAGLLKEKILKKRIDDTKVKVKKFKLK